MTHSYIYTFSFCNELPTPGSFLRGLIFSAGIHDDKKETDPVKYRSLTLQVKHTLGKEERI